MKLLPQDLVTVWCCRCGCPLHEPCVCGWELTDTELDLSVVVPALSGSGSCLRHPTTTRKDTP